MQAERASNRSLDIFSVIDVESSQNFAISIPRVCVRVYHVLLGKPVLEVCILGF